MDSNSKNLLKVVSKQQIKHNVIDQPIVENFGDDYDIDRLFNYEPELLNKLTNDDTRLTLLLRELIRRKKILLMDKESMSPFEADSVTLLNDGRILLTHPR